MGGTWDIVPELLGFTNPEQVDFYSGYPSRNALMASRQKAGIHPVDEIWLLTTTGEMTNNVLDEVAKWHCGLPEIARPSLHIRKLQTSRNRVPKTSAATWPSVFSGWYYIAASVQATGSFSFLWPEVGRP